MDNSANDNKKISKPAQQRAVALMHHISDRPGATPQETAVRPYKGRQAINRGWTEAVSHQAPGYVAKYYKNIDEARAKIERHPQFVEWKQPPAPSDPPRLVRAPRDT